MSYTQRKSVVATHSNINKAAGKQNMSLLWKTQKSILSQHDGVGTMFLAKISTLASWTGVAFMW